MHESRRARPVAYGVALLATAASLLIRWPLWPVLGDRTPFMTFFPAVIFSAYYGGWWPGLLATLLSAVAATYFLTEPLPSFEIGNLYSTVGLALFLLVGAIISGLSESLHRAWRRIITDERRRAEEAVRASEERFRGTFENAPVGIANVDFVGRFLRVNEKLCDIVGYSRQELLARTFQDITFPGDLATSLEQLEPLRRGDLPGYSLEKRYIRKDGSLVWVHLSVLLQRDASGSPAHAIAIVQDVSERKKAEDALRESEERYRSVIAAMQDGVVLMGADGCIRACNVSAERILGQSAEQMTGRTSLDPCWCAVHEDGTAFPGETHPVSVTLRTGQPCSNVTMGIHKPTGELTWLSINSQPLFRAGEALPYAVVASFSDITERKRAETLLVGQKQVLEMIVRGAPLPDVLEALVRIVEEQSEDEVIATVLLLEEDGLHLRPAAGARAPEGWTRTIDPLRIGPDVGSCGTAAYRREPVIVSDISSDPLWAEFRELALSYGLKACWSTPIFSSENKVLGTFALYYDTPRSPTPQDLRLVDIVTRTAGIAVERRQAELALRQAKAAAEAANRAKDEFLANVSHEMRTPMHAILGMTELVLDAPLTEDQRPCLKTVKSAADNLLGIINDLLDFSKIEAGKLELDPADFSLRTAVGDTLQALAMRAHTKGLKLLSHVEPDVPDALVGDAGRLRQVLLNLVGNAIKFTDRGEVVVCIARMKDEGARTNQDQPPDDPSSPMSHPSEVSLSFEVCDTGIGIPRDKQQTIFQAFEQEDTSTTRKYGGTGLGLTIASRLAALMGGTIAVASEPGRGSTFTFTARFDQHAHPVPAGAWPPVGAWAPDHGPTGKPLRILLAEDSEFNAQLLEHLLVRQGHRVRLANNGREALALAQEGSFDLLLLDIHMPELDGFQVVKAIRDREQAGEHLPVIALTARSRKEDRERCLAAGMDDFLAKPVRAADLWAALGRLTVARMPAEVRHADKETSRQGDKKTLDPAALLAACGGEGLLLRKMCQTFVCRLPDDLAAVRDALQVQDAPRLREAAHKLRGMVAAFSTAAGVLAADLEDRAAAGRLQQSRPLVAQLEAMARELMPLVDGLSLETLHHYARIAEESNPAPLRIGP